MAVDDVELISLAHLASSARMISTFNLLSHRFIDILIGQHLCSGRDLLSSERIHRRLRNDLPCQPDHLPPLLLVLVVREVVEEDLGVVLHVPCASKDVPSTLRSHRAAMSLKPMAFYDAIPIVRSSHRHEMVLDVWIFYPGVTSDEPCRLHVVRCPQPLPRQDPLDSNPELPDDVEMVVEGDRLLASVLKEELEVILEVLPDARQMMTSLHPDAAQMAAVTDTRQLQQMWRPNCSSTQDRFASCTSLFLNIANFILDPHRLLPLENNLFN
mmetsp:Transcript_9968/g.33245  ORF Transcript_9968/g.33245 Transcript_9968/m.33245 type:complete len:270 (-) Transcript_9968:943-1752(-)